ncbi:MAG TPA: acyl-CoA dehydrogenase family protein [bacterium]|nr:acyl-CoA dehydrogenase family protein [bacterium]
MGYEKYFKEEHNIFRQQFRSFLEKELAPHADEWEAAGLFPKEVFKQMGDLGFLGLRYPEDVGGMNADYWYSVVFFEEIPRCLSSGVALGLLVQTDMCTPAINAHGTPEQKDMFLKPAIRGDKIGAICVTEPGAGSDVKAIRTRAVKDGDYYIINGSKTFITNGTRADWLTMAVKTNPDRGYGGISLFLFPTDTPGFKVTRKLHKLGNLASDTAELSFEDCRVHKKYLLGEENKGFYYVMEGFQFERMAGAVSGMAGMQLVFEKTLEYCRTREVFGKPVSKWQANSHMLANLATEMEAAKALVYHCADMLNNGENALKEVSMCKLYVGELAQRVVDRCLQMYGGYGYIEEYYVARAYRDTRLITIGGGSSEVMREIIAGLLNL